MIVNAIDHGMEAQAAVDAPRLHLEDGLVYAEPGIDGASLEAAGRTLAWFREPNLFFGGCQAVERHRDTRVQRRRRPSGVIAAPAVPSACQRVSHSTTAVAARLAAIDPRSGRRRSRARRAPTRLAGP